MKELAAYLKDHLAGATAAVELLEHLKEKYKEDELGKFFSKLHQEVTSDREVLVRLLRRFSKEGPLRNAAAWLVEKFNRARIKLAGDKPGQLGLVEVYEVLVLGITGKQLLWRALHASLGESPLLKGFNLEELEQRAIDQLERVEAHRLEAARVAFLRG